jgi:predicted amidophosphoribosyltransferase
MKRPRVTCRQCGKTVSDTDVSCPSCGRKLDVAISAPASAYQKERGGFVGFLSGALVFAIFAAVVLGGWWLIIFVAKWMWQHF